VGGGGCGRAAFAATCDPFEVRAEIRSRLVPRVAILVEQPVDDAGDFGSHRGVPLLHGHGSAVENRLEHERRTRTLEGADTRSHLVEDDAERPEIRPRIDGVPACLLGRHVRGGAHRHTRVGEDRGSRDIARRGHLGHGCRQAEIQNLHLPARRDENVCGLEIAVDDPRRVRRGQPLGNLRRDVQQRLGAGDTPERHAVHELHDEVVRPDVVQLADMRVVQRSDGPRLAVEAFRELFLRDLDGNGSVEPGISGAIHVAHGP
jgi:hypothetical protein